MSDINIKIAIKTVSQTSSEDAICCVGGTRPNEDNLQMFLN